MWCNNCLLLFPLRGGAIVWAAFIAIYSVVGGVFMFKYGEFMWFRYYEPDIFGGLAMAIAFVALLNFFALTSRSLSFSRVCGFFWPIVLILAGVRAVWMIVELNKNKPDIQYECDHGGYLYGATASQYVNGTIPSFDVSVCSYGVSCVFDWTIVCVLIDIGCQLYMWFMNTRYIRELEKYLAMLGPTPEGYYVA